MASTKVLLPTPGTPVMPTRRALPVAGQEPREELLRERRIGLVAALDERDRLREDRPVLRADAALVRIEREAPARPPSFERFQLVEERPGGVGDDGARAEDRGGAGRDQRRVVVGRDHAADDDEDVGPARWP